MHLTVAGEFYKFQPSFSQHLLRLQSCYFYCALDSCRLFIGRNMDFWGLVQKFKWKLRKSPQNIWGLSGKQFLLYFHRSISLKNSLYSVAWILRDTEKKLAFKIIVFLREKLTFSTKPHTFLLSWAAVRVFLYSRFAHVTMMEKKKRNVNTQEIQRKEKEERFEYFHKQDPTWSERISSRTHLFGNDDHSLHNYFNYYTTGSVLQINVNQLMPYSWILRKRLIKCPIPIFSTNYGVTELKANSCSGLRMS